MHKPVNTPANDTLCILIVEDEEDIAALIAQSLEPLSDSLNVEFVHTASGEQALALHKKRAPTLVILDLQLLDLDGLSVCSRIKKQDEKTASSTSVVMLTARDSEKDVIIGYDLGVDDYITKPFKPRIFRARIQGILTKALKNSRAHTIDKNDLVYEDIVLDEEVKVLWVDDKPIFLSITEWSVLSLFVKHPGRMFSRSMIVDAVRGKGYPISPRAIDVQIFSIRKKISQSKRVVIETVRGVGYRLTSA